MDSPATDTETSGSSDLGPGGKRRVPHERPKRSAKARPKGRARGPPGSASRIHQLKRKFTSATSAPAPRSDEEDTSASEASSSASSETARLRRAHATAAPKAKAKAKAKAQRPPGSSSETESSGPSQRPAGSSSGAHTGAGDELNRPLVAPATSGLFDFSEWLVSSVLTDAERDKLSRAVTFGGMCCGMDTEGIVMEALRRATLAAGLRLKATCTFKAESEAWKREGIIRRGLQSCPQHRPHIFKDNAELSAEPPTNADGVPVQRPTCQIMFLGIVCKDISAYTGTPKSLADASGKSGSAWKACMDYLDRLPFEARPVLLLLECVARLSSKRAVDEAQSGCEQVAQQLASRGYTGHWDIIDPRNFYLPQSRKRVYGTFLRSGTDLGPKGAAAREADLTHARAIVARAQSAEHEPLVTVLDRVAASGDPDEEQPRRPAPKKLGANIKEQKWPARHEAFARKHNLSKAEVKDGADDFEQRTAHLHLTPQAQGGVWLQIVRMRNQRKIMDWKTEVLVCSSGASLEWMSIRRGCFPCVTPGMQFILLRKGGAVRVDGRMCLAVQGIQARERAAAHLTQETSRQLQDLAGNAFTANIMCAYLVAGLVVM
jgi:site-specific DNA-cytosine methylase